MFTEVLGLLLGFIAHVATYFYKVFSWLASLVEGGIDEWDDDYGDDDYEDGRTP